MDVLEEQLKVLRLQLEQSWAQTAEAEQEKAAAETEWIAQKAHLQRELERTGEAVLREPSAVPPQRIYV